MPDYKWRSEQRIVAYDDEAVVIEEVYPVGGPIEETPFVVGVYTRFENMAPAMPVKGRDWTSTDEKPCKP